MSLRRRVNDVEDRLGFFRVRPVPVIWWGRDEPTRSRIESLRELGQPFEIRLVRICSAGEADSMERAQELIEKHKREKPHMPIHVTKAGTQGKEPLTSWEPPLPDWLLEAMKEPSS